ncbi:hypothetical protein ACP275_12G006100 [Erythranthe tilingii]
MGEIVYIKEFLLAFLLFLGFRAWRNRGSGLILNWPLIGMLPGLLLRIGRIHEICTEVLGKSRRGTFHFQGPCFANMDMLWTVDPENIHYIMTSNFRNFPKGPEFREIFDVLGDGIFNSDDDSWKDQRNVSRALITHRSFHRFLAVISREKVEKGLIPVLEKAALEDRVLDLQDLFQRFTFDSICQLVTGYNPGCLSLDLADDVPFSKAMDDVEESIFVRHILPEKIWKLQRWLGVGGERRLSEASEILDTFIIKYIAMKRNEISRKNGDSNTEHENGEDLLTAYMNLRDGDDDDKFLRDTILNLMIAGRDTTSSALAWFVWLVSTHPQVENKIRDEIKTILPSGERRGFFGVDETKKLVYLHGALCKALRLYPPVPFQLKEPVEPDTLPSGHFVNPKMKVLFSLYAMGRMESIWGKDCLEFKPERWISEGGRSIRHEPSYKFLAFNAGPRTCLGKEVAFTQMKAVAAALIHNYRVWVVDGHRVVPNCSIILYMKDWLKVRVASRWSTN